MIYIRQSDPQQVRHHQESTDLQYGLLELGVALGWPRDRVRIIDDDLGKTGRVPEARIGFEQLVSEVALGHVGLVIGVEMSRLARNNQDWYRLFDMCAVVETLLADRDGVYDARDPNDRMLLGMKGLMSEMELHLMRGRLERGRLNKAARGALFIAPRIGYVHLPDGTCDLEPDEEARAVVRLVFQKFDELGAADAVFRYLREHQLRLPIRPHTGPHRGRLEWRDATHGAVAGILRHPNYAGVYVYGHRPVQRAAAGAASRPPQEQWKVFLRDKLPAYISWDQYLAHQKQLRDNRSRPDTPGTPRPGSALLAGLVVCGRCGRRLQVHYHGRGAREASYLCERATDLGRTDSCQGLQAGVLDELVTQQVLGALEPAALELSLQAADEVQRERERLDQRWQKQLERAAYDASRAERQYHAVEPENRLVARTLEQRWEAALRDHQQRQEEYARFQQRQALPPSPAERTAVERLARDLPALWRAPEVTPAERSQIVRCLLERVEVQVQNASEQVDVSLHWQGGFTSQHVLVRPVGHYTQLRDYDHLLERVRQLRADGVPARTIAERLQAEGFHPPRRECFTADMVRHLGRGGCRAERSDQEWDMASLSRRLLVPETRLRDWIRRGWVPARKCGGRWIAWADAAELERLRQLSAFQQTHGRFHPYPPELTSPRLHPAS
jgi:DNA invertase Pin-like site-specific DNA recombinase